MPFASAHLYLPLQDSNGFVYTSALVTLLDPATGGIRAEATYLDKDLTEEAAFPLSVTAGYLKLWAADPQDVIVRVVLTGGQYDWYSSFHPSADQTARGEENLLVSLASDRGDILTKALEDREAKFLSATAGRHNHESQGEDGIRMGPIYNVSNVLYYTSVYPRSVTLGEGWGMAGEDGVVLGAGERSPDWDIDFGEPSQEVVMGDYVPYTPQSVWLGQRSAYAWDEGGREMTVLMRNTASAYFLAPSSTIIGGLLVDTGAYGEDHVWIGHTSPSANGSRSSTVYLGVSTLPANTVGYEGSVNLGTEPEALLWSGRANANPEDAVAIGIDGAVSDFLGNFVDYGVDGYAYDLGDEDPTTPNPVPFHLRNTQIYKPGALDVLGDAVIGHSELADPASALLGFFSDIYDVDLTDAGDLVELVGHPFVDTDPIVLFNIVATAGLNDGATYYVVNATANDFQVEESIGGGAVVLTGDGTAQFQLDPPGASRASIATLPGDPPALLSLIAALTSYGLVISGEAPILADSMNRADGLVGYAQTGQVRESVAVSSNGFWGEDVEIVTSVAKRSANYDATPVISTYSTPVADVISEATIEAWGTAATDAGLFIRGIYTGADVVPIDGLLVAQDGLYKVEGGASLTLTLLNGYAAQADGVVMRVEADADTIEVFADNVSLGSFNPVTWCQTGTRHGYVLGAGDAAISEFILYAL